MADNNFLKNYYNDLKGLFKSGPIVRHRIANKISAPGDVGIPIGTARAFLKHVNNAYSSALASYGQYNRLARYCLGKTTKIVVNTKEGLMPIKEVVERFERGEKIYTYAYDKESKEMVCVPIAKAWETKVDEIWKVKFDDGLVLKCTKDHPIMLRDGSFREAQKLQPGDAVMPFHRKTFIYDKKPSATNYRWVYVGKRGWVPEHRLVVEQKLEIRLDTFKYVDHVVHHKNFEKDDNSLDNLELMLGCDHRSYHANINNKRFEDPKEREKQSQIAKDRWEEGGDLRENIEEITRKRLESEGWKKQVERLIDYNKAHKPGKHNAGRTDQKGFDNANADNSFSFQGICNAYREGMSVATLAKSLDCSIVKIRNRLKWEGYKSFTEFKQTYNNHKVVSVKPTGKFESVYDLTIDKYHNFAVGEMVDNSLKSLMVSNSDYNEMESMAEIGCVSGDTEVATLQGLVPIQDLAKTFLPGDSFEVWCWDRERCQYTIGQAHHPRQTGTKNIIEVMFDNGKALRCTADHRVLLRDGTYKQAGDLTAGDKVMPFNYRFNADGYLMIRNPDTSKSVPAHRYIFENVLEKDISNLQVHHLNHNKLDNRIKNLDAITAKQHCEYHKVSIVTKEKKSKESKNMWKDDFYRQRALSGLRRWQASDEGKKFMSEHTSRMNVDRWNNDAEYAAKMTTIFKNGMNKLWADPKWREWKSRHHSEVLKLKYANDATLRDATRHEGVSNGRFDRDITTEEILLQGQNFDRLSDFVKDFNFNSRCFQNKNGKKQFIERRLKAAGYHGWQDYKRNYTYGNHTVTSVRNTEDCVAVYDLTVDDYENFCLGNGIIISNSALDLYAEEVCSKGEYGEVIKIESSNAQIRDSLNLLFYDVLNIEFNAFSWVRNLCKYGDQFLLVDHHPDYGVLNALPMPVNEVERDEGYDSDNPLAYRYRWINQGNRVLENWQVVHFRMLGNDNFLPYGSSILEPARRVWRQLILMEDAVMVYRIVRSPERRVFYIGVGNVAPNDVPSFMERAKTQLKRNQVVDSSTGRVDLRYNPLSTDEDYFVPTRGEGDGTRIETLPGGQFTGDIDDLVYIQNKLFAALKVPKSYLGYEGDVNAKCLHPDTKVKLLDGRSLAIKEVCELLNAGQELYTYTMDEHNLNIIPGKVIAGGITRKNAQLVEVLLDNGAKIKCTPDHKFMLRDGSYREAKDLINKESLMPLYTKISSKQAGDGILDGYEKVFNPSSETYIYTHQLVAKYRRDKKDKDGKVIHHLDFNKLNNNPGNLDCSMTYREHRDYHSHLSHKTINSQENIQKRITNPDWLKSVSDAGKVGCLSLQKWRDAGGTHRVWNKGLTKETDKKVEQLSTKLRQYNDYVVCKNRTCENVFRQTPSRNSFTKLKEFCSTNCSSQFYMKNKREKEHSLYWMVKPCLTCDKNFETRKKKNSKFCSMFCRRNYDGYKQKSYSALNHKVVSVTWIEEKSDCYDISIDNFPNFAVADDFGNSLIFLHNSTLSQEDVRFARTIQRIQRIFIAELNKLAIIHLYSMGFKNEDLVNFEISMANPSTISELQRLELWRAKFEVSSLAQEGVFDRKFVYQRLFRLSEEDIASIEEGKRKDKLFDMEVEGIQSSVAPSPAAEAAPDAGAAVVPSPAGPEAGLPPPPGEEAGGPNEPITAAKDPNKQVAAPNELVKVQKARKERVVPDLAAHAFGYKKTAMDPKRNHSELTRMVKAPFGEEVDLEEQLFKARATQLTKFARDLESVDVLNKTRKKVISE